MYYVYAIKSKISKRIYIGHTQDLDQRLDYHNSGYVRSTANESPWILIAKQSFATRSEARWMERQLKRSRGKREKWIIQNTLLK